MVGVCAGSWVSFYWLTYTKNRIEHMQRIILASTSKYRRTQLEQLGIPFEAHASHVDEEVLKAEELSVQELALALARLKAEALAESFPDALLIGGDQIAEVDGEILNKPETFENACAQLKRLSGRAHHLWTAIAIHQPSTGRTEQLIEQHIMNVRPLTDGQIEYYVKHDMPLDCCGSYKIESMGISLFSSIEGKDHSAIVGVPLMQLVATLQTFGVQWPPSV